MKEKITALREDKRAVSPVIGVIMMIAIVVIIAAVVAAFAYGIIGGVNKVPSTALVVEGVRPGDGVNVSIFHHGGDSITEAFNATEVSVGGEASAKWANLVVKLNGATLGGTYTTANAALTGGTMMGLWMNDTYCSEGGESNMASGDMIKVKFTKLKPDDSIVILHAPSDSILQRVTVM